MVESTKNLRPNQQGTTGTTVNFVGLDQPVLGDSHQFHQSIDGHLMAI